MSEVVLVVVAVVVLKITEKKERKKTEKKDVLAEGGAYHEKCMTRTGERMVTASGG